LLLSPRALEQGITTQDQYEGVEPTRLGGLEDFKISAIVPLYNGERFIEEALVSISHQTLKPIEVIVIDDGSTDGGVDKVRNLDLGIPLKVVGQENAGQSAARNEGARLATGDHLAFLDQDDVWYPRHLELLARAFVEWDGPLELGWSYGDLDILDINGNLVSRAILKRDQLGWPHPKENLLDLLAHDMFVVPSASLVLKEAFFSVDGFDERLMGFEDDDLFLRLFRARWGNAFVEDSVGQWRIYLQSSSYSWRMRRSRRIYAEKLFEMFFDDRVSHKYYVRDVMAPRFLYQVLGGYARAVEMRDGSHVNVVDDVYFFSKRLRFSRRVKWHLLTPLLRWRSMPPWILDAGSYRRLSLRQHLL